VAIPTATTRGCSPASRTPSGDRAHEADLIFRVAVSVPVGEAEITRATFVELAPSGFEEVDRGDRIELAAYVEDPARLRSAFPDASATVVPEGLWLGPPWEDRPDDLPSVVIDPGRAFGTGSHPTTQLCLELLSGIEPGSLLDIGCGSGVLAIAGARLGHRPVIAVDADPVAVESTRANADLNGVSLEAAVLDALVDPLPAVDVVVANVLLAPVEHLLTRIEARAVVTSGYLADERPAHQGWVHVRTVERDGWAADRFSRLSV
jgi:ribosomal protein L11 methyltransferase